MPKASLYSTEVALARILAPLLDQWYTRYGRDLPMRRPDVTPWATLVFEVMSQQTPILRVEPIWTVWMRRWPTPAALAQAASADVLVEWDRLGYPSRALRLRDCAAAIAARPGGEVPADYDELLSLPGIGPYTASALASFQFHQRRPVLDTNVRRVLSRVIGGKSAPPSAAPTKREIALATSVLPADGQAAARWNVAVMEFGALVCTSRTPQCDDCPLRQHCQWARTGFPVTHSPRRSQAWTGTDRQARGRVIEALRRRHRGDASGAPTLTWQEALAEATLPGAEEAQAARVLEGLLADGLIIRVGKEQVALP
ncbi:A/G-specific adenine glycosylase [Schaalia suimastitidis]|uniref:A/G-specific adenine glycosylase n=1 Tax=Schaalia suimastitidis TaxID=121163 RepID=UPI00041468F2|nr:A/G-specific adenine glycosylase [Schaalia suimastitidis]